MKTFLLQDNSTGQVLLDVVFRHLDLLETAYFGLRYVDQDNQTVSKIKNIVIIFNLNCKNINILRSGLSVYIYNWK